MTFALLFPNLGPVQTNTQIDSLAHYYQHFDAFPTVHTKTFENRRNAWDVSWSWTLVCACYKPSSETQGRSVGPGEKARRKFSSMDGKAPGYRLSPDHFQKVKRMLAPADWAQKMLCIVVPNGRTVSPELFSWVRTQRLLSRHSCPVRSPSFPNQKRRNYRWVEKRFGGYQHEQFNLHWENSVSDGSQCIVNNRKFKMQRRRGSKRAIAWQGKTTTLHVHHAFLDISLPSLHDYQVIMPNFTFCEGRNINKQWRNFLSLYKLGYGW